MFLSTKVIRELENLDPKVKNAFFVVLEELEAHVKETVRRTDFLELKKVISELGERTVELAEAQKNTEQKVGELAEAQRKSEERISRLEVAVKELALAQKKTEERLSELAEAQRKSEERISRLEVAVKELALAQKKTEERLSELAEAQRKSEERISRLEVAVKELALAQKKTEERVNRLAEAQNRTEQRLNELAEAQKKTEQELRSLIQEHKKTRELLGNLTETVGHGLEDRIMPFIPSFAQKEYGIKVSLVERKNIIYPDGTYDEVNIYAEGKKDGQKVYLIGECKARPGKKDVDRFLLLVKRLSNHLKGQIYPFMVGYTYDPQVESYVIEKYPELRMLKSYEFEMKYSRRRSSP